MTQLLLAALISLAAAQDVPYYQRSTEQDQDLGGMGQNFRDLTDRGVDRVGGAQTREQTCFDDPTFCVDVTSRVVILGSNGLRFSDGTTQTVAPASTGTVRPSSCTTANITGTTTNQNIPPTIAMTTLTIVTGGNRVELWFAGSMSAASGL